MKAFPNPNALPPSLLQQQLVSFGVDVPGNASKSELVELYNNASEQYGFYSMHDDIPDAIKQLSVEELSSALSAVGQNLQVSDDNKDTATQALFSVLCNEENLPPAKKPCHEEINTTEQAVQEKEKGNQLYKQQKFREAIPFYNRAISLDPSNPAFYNNRAAALLMLSEYSKALLDAEKALSIDPENIKYHMRAARCYLGLGRNSDAARHCKRILENNPKQKDALKELDNINKVENFKSMAEKAVDSGHYNNAISFLTQALNLSSASVDLKLRMAAVYLKQDNIGEADRISSAILRSNSMNTDALHLRGLCFARKGDMDKAILHFKRGLQSNPDHIKCRTSLKETKRLMQLKQEGNDAFKQGDNEKAHELYSQALEVDPSNSLFNAKLYLNRAIVGTRLGKMEEAIDDCTKAIEADSQYTKALMKRSELYLQQEQFEEAVRDLESASEIDPSNHDIRSKLKHAKIELKKSKRKNYYKILGVPSDAADGDIKRAYKKAAMTCHPDRVQGDEAKAEAEKKFKEIGEAYKVLSDPQLRARFDRGEDLDDPGSGFHPGGVDMSDLFSMFAGGHGFGGHGFSGHGQNFGGFHQF